MRKLLVIPALLILAGCNSAQPNLIETKYISVMPNDSFFRCPTIKTFPNPKNLDDIAVAKLIITLYQDNKVCKNSITAIKNYLNDAQQTINKH